MRTLSTLSQTCALFVLLAFIAGCGAATNYSNSSLSSSDAKLSNPTITWNQPSSVPQGTVLGPSELNASADVPGTFTYTPAAGTVLQPGTQTLNAAFTPQDQNKYAPAKVSRTINVTGGSTSPTLKSIALSSNSVALPAGGTQQLTATATYSDKSTQDVTGSASWSSSSTAVATVASGKVTGVTAGTAQITASWNGMQATAATVTVTAPAATLQKIQVTGSSTIASGNKTQLKATGTYSDQSTKDLTASASWSSSNTSVAVVQAGTVNGINPGTASISASLSGVSASASISVSSKYAVQVDPSMSMSQIQSAINSSQPGDTIAFAAGTYNLTYPALRLQAGRTYLGSTAGATILSGTGGYDLMTFYGDGLTVQNFTFNGGGLYLGGPVTGVNVENNLFENIGAPYTNWTTEIAVFIDTSAANSDISHNAFKNLGGPLLTEFVDESFSSGIFGYGLSNVTIENNSFDTFNEGIHIFYNNLDGKNVHINSNTFVHGHRIAIEQQNSNAGGLEVASNTVSEPLNAWALTFGLSIAATSQSGTGISVHDNLVNGDTPVGAGCTGSGCYYPYGIEAWGTGTQIYNNTIEGLWNHGVAIGDASGLSVTGNTICGPNMAANNTFVDFEYGSEPNTTISGNTTSSSMTCAPAK
jgi:hypothetical protein